MLLSDLADKLLRGNAFPVGLEHDRRAVRVVRANIITGVAALFLEAYPDVGLDVFDQMADMDRAVSIRQSTGDEDVTNRHRSNRTENN